VRKVLIQQASGAYVEMMRATSEDHCRYAQAHGFAFLNVLGDVQSERGPHWDKIRLIQLAFEMGFDFVAWLDADTLLIDSGVSLLEGLPEGPPIGMCRHPMPWRKQVWHYNSGVMLIRNEQLSRRFFENVWKAGPVDHPWQEQVRIVEEADKSPGAVQSIEPRWNCTEGSNPCSNPVVLAWHGHGKAALPRLEGALRQLRRRDAERLRSLSDGESRMHQEAVGKDYCYRRVGFDERALCLAPNGVVGEGARDCERFWGLREVDGQFWLGLYSYEKLTCDLRLDMDGTWRGRWVDHEKMPIELVPKGGI
jgi:hypothetical protein